jgi:protein-L-isoaspartate O-methyltransferase
MTAVTRRSPQVALRTAVGFALILTSLPAVAQTPPYVKKLAPYVSSPFRAVDRMLELAALKPGETLYDLGAGDGRIVISAARRYGVKAVGIEMNEKLVKSANDRILKFGLQDRAKVIQGDLLRADLAPADVVVIFLQTMSNEELRPKLEKYLKPGSRVLSYSFAVPGWKPVLVDRTDEHSGHLIYLYEMPPVKN